MYHIIVLVAASISVLASCVSASAFDNIEADVAYGRAIKEQILKEFSIAMKMLKDQADSLGTTAREKDIQTFQEHLYNKAILMGQCVDIAISAKKNGSDKTPYDTNVNRCIEAHLKFMNDFSPRDIHEIMCLEEFTNFNPSRIARAYDFLNTGKIAPGIIDYIGTKQCVEHLRRTKLNTRK